MPERFAVGLGVTQVGWIVVQLLLLRMTTVLHAVYGGLGLGLAVLALTPSVRRYLGR